MATLTSKRWAQALQSSAVGGFDKHPGVDRKSTIVGVACHVFDVTGLNVTVCHEGAQVAFAHVGLYQRNCSIIQSSRLVEPHA